MLSTRTFGSSEGFSGLQSTSQTPTWTADASDLMEPWLQWYRLVCILPPLIGIDSRVVIIWGWLQRGTTLRPATFHPRNPVDSVWKTRFKIVDTLIKSHVKFIFNGWIKHFMWSQFISQMNITFYCLKNEI